MRLIDADAALNEINGVFEIASNMTVLPVGVVKALIRNMLTLETITPTVSGWVSVKDRLPDKPCSCLVFLIYGWRALERWEGDSWVLAKESEVTHWMPLPEPPKEENHETD